MFQKKPETEVSYDVEIPKNGLMKCVNANDVAGPLFDADVMVCKFFLDVGTKGQGHLIILASNPAAGCVSRKLKF